MALTLPAVLGTRITLDSEGAVIFDSTGDSVDVRKSWSVEQVDGGALDATGPGTRYAAGEGLKLWGAGGALTIHLDASDGSADFAGDVHIGGTTLIDDDTTIEGTLTIGTNLNIDGFQIVWAGVTLFATGGDTIATNGSFFAQDDMGCGGNLNVVGDGTFVGSVSAASLNVGPTVVINSGATNNARITALENLVIAVFDNVT